MTTHAKLVLLWLLFTASQSSAECPVPPGFENHVTRTEGNLKFTFALDQFAYVLDADTIHFHFSVENLGTESARFDFPGAPDNMFAIYPITCSSLDQPGCFEAAPFFMPQLYFWFNPGFTLLPGQCKEYSMDWTQDPNRDVAPALGNYRGFAGLWTLGPPNGWPGMFMYASGLTLDLEFVGSPTPVVPATWGRIKALYR